MEGKINETEKMTAALAQLVDPEEYFLDYLQYTSHRTIPRSEGEQVQLQLVHETITHAENAFKKQDIPFYPPEAFETERYRDPKLMRRINTISAKR